MSGHSKFANIKHKKEKNDAAKGKIFTIIGREIAVAVKEGGPDPANNFKLAQVIAKAKSNNMPNDTIERGIKKAAGDGNSVNYEFCTYEGYGPSGTAIIVKCLTDNKNRTAANVRNAFTKGHGSIGTQGCVSYMFDEKGQITTKNAWAIATVQGILDNDFYIGTLRQGKYTRAKINGKDIKRNDDEHIVIENHHQAIIDYRTFAITRALREKRSRSNYRGVKVNDNVYSGFCSAATAAARCSP